MNQIPVTNTTSKQQYLEAASSTSACLTYVCFLQLQNHAKFALKSGTLLYMFALCNLDVTDCPLASSFHPPASCLHTRSICQLLTRLYPPLLPMNYQRQLAALEPLYDRLMLLASHPLLLAYLLGQTAAMLWNQSRCQLPPKRGTGGFDSS